MLAEPLALAGLRFDNRYARELPADPVVENYRRQVAGACYSRVLPTPVRAPRLVGWAPEAAALLDLPPEPTEEDALAEVFGGNRVLDGMAVLRSSLREFLCSEAMHHLGVPTTRALALVATGETVTRDILYDGHPAPEPGAVVCRMAPSFTRFGHFEMLAARRETALLRRFVDFTIATDFPHLLEVEEGKKRCLAWFQEVCERTAEMIAQWMRVGFVHGVMNTDNMSILGLTIDYGPYGWLEDYQPDWTPNTTDAASPTSG